MRKYKHITFFNKAGMFALESALLALIAALLFATIWFWGEMPWYIRVLSPTLFGIMLITIVFTACYGMYVYDDGTVRLFFLIRIYTYRPDPTRQISVIFTECENGRFLPSIEIKENGEEIFFHDYSWQFYGTMRKRLAMLLYTLSPQKTNEICKYLSTVDNIEVTLTLTRKPNEEQESES